MTADIDPKQRKLVDKLLLEAVSAGEGGRVDLCLQKGADINVIQPGSKRTPLMIAAIRFPHSPGFVERLIEKGADLFLEDSEGKSVFDYVQGYNDADNRKKMLDMLLKKLPDAPAKKAANDFNAAAEVITLDKATPPSKPLTFKPPQGGQP